MRKLNRKGFTLIELLAVIVVLAIVAVLATSQILPLLERTRKNAFAAEANNVIDAASKAMTLIQIGEKQSSDLSFVKYTAGSGDNSGTYCFTLTQLVNNGVLSKDLNVGKSNEYTGKVVVGVPQNYGAYEYTVIMKNNQFSIDGTKKGTVTEEDVKSPAQNVSVNC